MAISRYKSQTIWGFPSVGHNNSTSIPVTKWLMAQSPWIILIWIGGYPATTKISTNNMIYKKWHLPANYIVNPYYPITLNTPILWCQICGFIPYIHHGCCGCLLWTGEGIRISELQPLTLWFCWQDYAADESESVQCKEGDQFEVVNPMVGRLVGRYAMDPRWFHGGE